MSHVASCAAIMPAPPIVITF